MAQREPQVRELKIREVSSIVLFHFSSPFIQLNASFIATLGMRALLQLAGGHRPAIRELAIVCCHGHLSIPPPQIRFLLVRCGLHGLKYLVC